MEQQSKAVMPSNKLGMIYGFGTGVAMVAYNYLLQFLKVDTGSWPNYILIALFLGGVLTFCYAFSRKEENDTSFGGVFKAGFRMVAILTLVLLAATLITAAIDPTIKNEAMKANRAAMIAAKRNPADIEKSLRNASDNFTLTLVMGVVFTNIFYGVVFAAIGAALFRKNKA